MTPKITLKKLWNNSRKLLTIAGCLLVLTFGWIGSEIPDANAVSLSDSHNINRGGSYGRAGEADREAKRVYREENSMAKSGNTAEKTPPGMSARTDNSADANSLHGRERLEVGRIQSAMDEKQGKSQGVIRAITDTLNPDK
ncbi:hypothetical protein V0288_16095 [Pannus brasiliensis CCIBt3594]|uniref:Uncharacterized protein n=1 Tax=Pannus brasiliensis CCIBt3594 TaxID=1427578 RepID=A0AAW9QTQ7_9CHRO